MATIRKVNITRYLLNGKQVKKGTPGAEKVQVESEKYYACYREGKRQVRVPLATDKKASQVMLAELLKAKERGEAGLTDKFKPSLDKPLTEHLTDHLEGLKGNVSAEHHKEVTRILNKFLTDSQAKTLRDVTPDRVTSYLSKLTCGNTTKNMHRRLIVGFMNDMERRQRISTNPITSKNVKVMKRGKKRQRRALNSDDLVKLVETVEAYNLRKVSVNTGGRSKTKEARPCKLSDAYVEKLRQRGRERGLLYKLAIWTGLRRGEIARLRVSHLELDVKPYARLVLPSHLTKNNKGATILLVPQLAEELKTWIADRGKKPTDGVVNVPQRGNLSRLHRSVLKMAEIPYEVDGKFSDFHSLRTSANTLLRRAGIPLKERQLFLRHSKPDLTNETYDDETFTNMKEVVAALANVKL